jgi:Na+-translocating ferredoxin:NAD+ oxidoreductase RnfC subunit
MNGMGYQQPQSSTFAQMVDQLRTKSEAELKMLYIQFFKNDLNEEWTTITQSSDFKNATEEDIIKAIQKKRYSDNV